ncbi:hypothetical protein [Bradyrhizobium sp. USDA 4504]
MTKERLSKDAADAFRLLRAFRSIRDRAARRRVIETVEAMANGDCAPDDAMSVTTDQNKVEPAK